MWPEKLTNEEYALMYHAFGIVGADDIYKKLVKMAKAHLELMDEVRQMQSKMGMEIEP